MKGFLSNLSSKVRKGLGKRELSREKPNLGLQILLKMKFFPSKEKLVEKNIVLKFIKKLSSSAVFVKFCPKAEKTFQIKIITSLLS